jgi:hypothetical protein
MACSCRFQTFPRKQADRRPSSWTMPLEVRLAGRACRTSGSRDEDGFRSLPAPGSAPPEPGSLLGRPGSPGTGQRRRFALTGAGGGENVSPSKPGDRKVGGSRHFLAGCYRSMPSLRSSTIAARRHRIVSGENGSVNGMPFALRSGLPSRSTQYVPGCRLDGRARCFEPAGELANVFPHSEPAVTAG